MATKRGSFAWTDGPNIRGKWTPRVALGLFSMFTLTVGSVVMLATLGFLYFLWLSEGAESGGEKAPAVWRAIILGGYITPVVTICAAILRIIQASQALLVTSLMAALLLERYGVPMIHVAEVSILRSVNSGPWRLLPLFISSLSFLNKVKFPFLMNLIVLFTSLGTQFTSTLLVADLSVSTLVGPSQVVPIGVALNLTRSRYDKLDVTNMPPVFSAFAEISGPNATTTKPNDRGMSDTGVIRRVFVGLPEEQRSVTRSFQGKAHAMSSRYVCARPAFTNGTGLLGTSENTSLDFTVPSLQGNISFPATLMNAGLEFPPDCGVNGSCYTRSASVVDCTLPFVPEGEIAGGVILTEACFPYRGNVLLTELSGDEKFPLRNYSQAVFIIKSNFTTSNLDGNIVQKLSNETVLALPNGTPDGEFLTWELDGIFLSVSVCFQQTYFELLEVTLSADADLTPAKTSFNGTTELWNADAPARQLGVDGGSETNASSRGLFTVQATGESVIKSLGSVLQQGVLYMGNSQLQTHGLVVMLSPNAFGNLAWNLHQATAALATTALERTGRPGLALDALMTTVARANIDNIVPFFGVFEDGRVVSSVTVLAPRRLRGLAVVTALVMSSLLCVALVAGLFLAKTRHSIHGNYWHVVAQVFSEETQWILDDATEVGDQTVARMMSGPTAEMDVKIGRSYNSSGRVQVVPYRRPGRG